MGDIVLAGSTSGTCTLTPAAVSGTTVLTLPTANGTVITTGNIPTGSVLQVVSATYSTTVSSTSSTFADTGLSATITPSSSSNKILVLITQRAFSQINVTTTINLLRSSTIIFYITRYGLTDSNVAADGNYFSSTYLDSPATTSAIIYKTQFARQSGSSTSYMQLDSDPSTITLMEIKG